MKYFILALKTYANFSGRARRKEYWFFTLFSFLIFLGYVIVEGFLETSFMNNTPPSNISVANPIGYALIFLVIFLIIPGWSVTIRRLHDSGRSGWWMLLIFVPFGGIVILVFMLEDSSFGPNKYGLNPKGLGNPDEIDQIGNYLQTN